MPGALLVSSSFLPGKGGIESYLAQLCDELAPHLSVLAPHKRDGLTLPNDLAYPATGYAGSMLVPGPRVARAIASEAKKKGVRRVLFGTPWPLVLVGPRLRKEGISYSVIAHGAELLVPSVVPVLRRRLAQALSQADLLLAVSDFTRRKAVSFLERAGSAIPRTGLLRARVDLERFNPRRADPRLKGRLGLLPDQMMILCFGRLVPRKGVHRLIRVADEIAARAPEAAIVVAGTGPEERRLRRLASRVRTPVVFAGRVSEEEAPSYYATADVFALPVADRWFGLDAEGLGVVLLEAAASQTPCVTGRSGGSPEAVREGETGFVVDANQPGALVDRIVRLLQDGEQRARMGRAGREFVAKEFSTTPVPQALLDWLEIPAPDGRA